MQTAKPTSKTWTPEKRLVAVALAALLLAVYAGTLAGFVSGWHEEENAHGPLVPLLAAFVVWMNWGALRRTPVRGAPKAGLIVLGLALFLQVAGAWLGFARSVGYSFVLALVGLSLYFLGTALTAALAFPLAFLLFMVPTPGGLIDQVSAPLQLLSAHCVQSLAERAGVVVQAEGVSLHLPYAVVDPGARPPVRGITLQVAEGCSGLHSLTAMAMLSAILAYFMAVPARWKWALFALALPAAMVGNVVRILLVVLVANARGEKAGMDFHDGSLGKLVPFLTAFLIVMALGRALEWRLARKERGKEEKERQARP